MESGQIHFRIHPVNLLKPRYLLLEKETEFYRCALMLNHPSHHVLTPIYSFSSLSSLLLLFSSAYEK
ncbi:hypothetical protein RchiOBHm_Chr7g0243831 [Rosa chinensis]|uniref:Uncharacterized protein n=1 Tax=Rosa chinensis TaxID=74649 RepID=A0A2P6PIW4_ROSCH|nr:hypothetical protein RchiOBHm_Chr7g0243831 [Rosa chinensis]